MKTSRVTGLIGLACVVGVCLHILIENHWQKAYPLTAVSPIYKPTDSASKLARRIGNCSDAMLCDATTELLETVTNAAGHQALFHAYLSSQRVSSYFAGFSPMHTDVAVHENAQVISNVYDIVLSRLAWAAKSTNNQERLFYSRIGANRNHLGAEGELARQ